jgi:lipopolysaccharide transport system ATP-binding protein
VRLDLAPGQYTFAIGLASIEPAAIALASEMSYPALDERCRPVIVASHAGAFVVTMRTGGHALTHHGLCDLAGDMDGLLLGPLETSADSASPSPAAGVASAGRAGGPDAPG